MEQDSRDNENTRTEQAILLDIAVQLLHLPQRFQLLHFDLQQRQTVVQSKYKQEKKELAGKEANVHGHSGK